MNEQPARHRRLPVLSPSQIETHQLCPRKRFIKNALRVPEAQSSSAMVGDRVHTHSDNYLEDGTLPPGDDHVSYQGKWSATTITKHPGAIFLNGRRFLPEPFSAVSEGKFKMVTPSGLTFMGARDWVRRPGSPGGLLLGDNKTTSSPIYAKSYDELLTDIQGNLYAHELLTNPFSTPYKNLPPDQYGRWLPSEVPARWVYYLTEDSPNPPKKSWATKDQLRKWDSWVAAGRPLAWAVDTVYYPDRVKKRVAEIDAIGQEMARIQESTTNPMDVPANLDACEAFGGCAYRGTAHCQLTTADVYKRQLAQFDQTQKPNTPETLHMTQTDPLAAAMERAAQMRAAQAAANPAAVTPPPVFASTWQPGDPFNTAQDFMAASGVTVLWIIAMAATNAPSAEVAQSWPGAKSPYTAEINASIAAARATHTPVGQPEAGTINPPVGQGGVTEAARNPEEHQAMYERDQALIAPPPVLSSSGPGPVTTPEDESNPALRTATKEMCISRGVCDPATGKLIDASSRHSLKTLRAALAAHVAKDLTQGVPAAPAVAAPAAPAVPYVTPEDLTTPPGRPLTPRERLVAALRDIADAILDGAI